MLISAFGSVKATQILGVHRKNFTLFTNKNQKNILSSGKIWKCYGGSENCILWRHKIFVSTIIAKIE